MKTQAEFRRFLIVSAVFMIGEKADGVITADAMHEC